MLLIDLQNAYNSILRQKMMQFLYKRCKNQPDNFLVSLIEKLHLRQQTLIGKYSFDTGRGVAQGSVLSSFLFNVYLHETLGESSLIWQLIARGDLLAYADDLIIQVSSLGELQLILKEFEKLKDESKLILNLNKCEILAPSGATNIGELVGGI